MQLADLLEETFESAALECWQRERTAAPVSSPLMRHIGTPIPGEVYDPVK